ncbi:MAG: hypothetical protein ACTSRI_09755 [Promethearchaeota archaeon]
MSEFEKNVLSMLENINMKLDTLIKSEGAKKNVIVSTSSISGDNIKPSNIVEKQEEKEKLEAKPIIEGRRICPNCNGTAFNMVEDKSQVLHQMGGIKIYAKKYICKSCGYEL